MSWGINQQKSQDSLIQSQIIEKSEELEIHLQGLQKSLKCLQQNRYNKQAMHEARLQGEALMQQLSQLEEIECTQKLQQLKSQKLQNYSNQTKQLLTQIQGQKDTFFDEMEAEIQQSRNDDVQKISEFMHQINEMFIETSNTVNHQGEQLDRIDMHITTGESLTKRGVQQLEITQNRQRRKRNWIFLILFIVFVFVVVLITTLLVS